jgi:hypothetical protein
MTNFRIATLLVLTTLPISVGFLAPPATAQSARPAVPVGQLPITTSTLVSVGPGETFGAGGVRVPPCPTATTFLATAVQAAPYLPTFGGGVAGLPKWAVSVHIFQVTYNGSFSPLLTAFAAGPEQASTSIAGGQPLSTDEDANVEVRILGSAAATNRPFAVHVTGYCGLPFVIPASSGQ